MHVCDQRFFLVEAVVKVPDCGAVGLSDSLFRDGMFGFAPHTKKSRVVKRKRISAAVLNGVVVTGAIVGGELSGGAPTGTVVC